MKSEPGNYGIEDIQDIKTLARWLSLMEGLDIIYDRNPNIGSIDYLPLRNYIKEKTPQMIEEIKFNNSHKRNQMYRNQSKIAA